MLLQEFVFMLFNLFKLLIYLNRKKIKNIVKNKSFYQISSTNSNFNHLKGLI